MNCDFFDVINATDVHDDFQSEKKEIMSCPFHVSFVGETFNF